MHALLKVVATWFRLSRLLCCANHCYPIIGITYNHGKNKTTTKPRSEYAPISMFLWMGKWHSVPDRTQIQDLKNDPPQAQGKCFLSRVLQITACQRPHPNVWCETTIKEAFLPQHSHTHTHTHMHAHTHSNKYKQTHTQTHTHTLFFIWTAPIHSVQYTKHSHHEQKIGPSA